MASDILLIKLCPVRVSDTLQVKLCPVRASDILQVKCVLSGLQTHYK